MAEDLSNEEAGLNLLGQRVREGWAKLHPPTAQHREAVRDVVRQQMERMQQAAKHLSGGEEVATGEAAREQKQTKSKSMDKSKSGGVQGENVPDASKKRKQSNDHGHSH